jgi:hypothetical protein
MTFSATDAAFEGFRVVRRKPMVLLWWTLFYLVIFGLIALVVAQPLTNFFSLVQQYEGTGGEPTPDEIMGFMLPLMATIPLLIPLLILQNGIVYSAIARSVLHPEKSAFGYLRLGMDEVRVAVVVLVLGILFNIIGFVGYMAVLLLAGGASAIGDGGYPGGVGLFGMLGMLLVYGVMWWLMARLSLAVPITVAEKKFAFFDSFKMTEGHTLKVIGMAILAGVMAIVVAFLVWIIAVAIFLAVGSTVDWQSLEMAGFGEVIRVAGPMIALGVVIYAVYAALMLVVMLAPFSAAYRDLKGRAASQLA